MTRPTPDDATLSEVFSDRAIDAAAVGFVLAHLDQDKPVLWVQDRVTRKETGRPFLQGLLRPLDVIHVDVSRAVDVLWAMEEGLRCSDFGAVLGEIWGDPPALDFTATKRLALRSEAHRIPAWIIRRAATAGLSAARNRWRVSSLQSLNHPWDNRAPGTPVWQADLFRTRWGKPGRWVARFEEGRLHMDHGIEADSHAEEHRA